MRTQGTEAFTLKQKIAMHAAIFQQFLHVLKESGDDEISVVCYSLNQHVVAEHHISNEFIYGDTVCVVTCRDKKIILTPMSRKEMYERSDVSNYFFSVLQIFPASNDVKSIGPMTRDNALDVSKYLLNVLQTPYYYYQTNADLLNPKCMTVLKD